MLDIRLKTTDRKNCIRHRRSCSWWPAYIDNGFSDLLDMNGCLCPWILPHLALLKGVHPSGRMLSSMKVFKKTVVAKSFHGRPKSSSMSSWLPLQVEHLISLPRKHLSAVTVVALASGDWDVKLSADFSPCPTSENTYSDDRRVWDIGAIPISRCVGEVCSLPSDQPTPTSPVREGNILEPAISQEEKSSWIGTSNIWRDSYAVPKPKTSFQLNVNREGVSSLKKANRSIHLQSVWPYMILSTTYVLPFRPVYHVSW